MDGCPSVLGAEEKPAQPPEMLLTQLTSRACTQHARETKERETEEVGAAGDVVHGEDCFFNILACVVQGAFWCH